MTINDEDDNDHPDYDDDDDSDDDDYDDDDADDDYDDYDDDDDNSDCKQLPLECPRRRPRVVSDQSTPGWGVPLLSFQTSTLSSASSSLHLGWDGMLCTAK